MDKIRTCSKQRAQITLCVNRCWMGIIVFVLIIEVYGSVMLGSPGTKQEND